MKWGFFIDKVMSLLREIQNDAVNSKVKVSDLLRKCKILAARLGNDNFKIWIDSELNGYTSNESLPAYRILNVTSKGHFTGVFGSSLRNVDIPSVCFSIEHHEDMTNSFLMSPIAELEVLVGESLKKGKNLRDPWNTNFVALFGGKIYKNYTCMQAWKEISSSQVFGIIDTIKTKILNFVLEIEMINKDAGDVEVNSNPIPQDKVSQIFNINVSGNVQNLASGNHQSNIQQEVANTQLPEDFIKLISDLKQSNIEDNIALEVEKRIEQLAAVVGTSEYKSQYSDLMSFVSNHVTVLGFLAPYIVMLTSYLI